MKQSWLRVGAVLAVLTLYWRSSILMVAKFKTKIEIVARHLYFCPLGECYLLTDRRVTIGEFHFLLILTITLWNVQWSRKWWLVRIASVWSFFLRILDISSLRLYECFVHFWFTWFHLAFVRSYARPSLFFVTVHLRIENCLNASSPIVPRLRKGSLMIDWRNRMFNQCSNISLQVATIEKGY